MWQRTTGSLSIVFLLSLAAGACEEACGCSPPPPELAGAVEGTVYSPDAVPVVGAMVVPEQGEGECGDFSTEGLDDGVTDDSGSFRIEVFSYDPLEGACLRLRALPPGGSALHPSEFVEVVLGTDEPASAQVDLYLRAAPGTNLQP